MEITKVTQAHSKYHGVKTAIPATYARELGIERGDELTWELDKDKKGKFLIVRKAD